MLRIFYKSAEEILLSSNKDLLHSLDKESVLWIDLIEPTGEEKRSAEAFLGTQIQSRAQAEEIESSSRFHEAGGIVFANTNFLSPMGDEMGMDPVSFTLSKYTLTTLREIPIRSFDLLSNKIQARPELYKDGFSIFVEIIDKRVDLDADIVELISQETSQFSKRINQQEDINQEFLLDINQLQENAMVVRENVVDKQRIMGNILKSDLFPDSLDKKFSIILQDINSLINHINFTFERLEYLQDTVVGIINLDQNRIMKMFTLISLLLMPATLVASFYGMNVALPFSEWPYIWICILAVMVVIVVLVIIFFKRKKMM
ncbi:MAG: CorA family divalent cation transporter [Candidatus Cryptobacteroides sp.]